MERYSSRSSCIVPDSFFNLKHYLPSLPPPPLHPATGEPIGPRELESIFSPGFVRHETSMDPKIPIPERVREVLDIWRPTPVIRARGLERYLGVDSKILYKYEGVSPTGSHKSNTAVVQAHLAAEGGIDSLVTETGAGQWGAALAHACGLFGLRARVFMVSSSYRKKPGRRALMQLLGAEVLESPSRATSFGRSVADTGPDHPGSLGIAISEAVEEVLADGRSRYCLGSVLDAVLLHQTVIGQEALTQMRGMGCYPDVVIGCVGGGSNFGGLAFPFLGEMLRGGEKSRFVAVESEACASLTRGELRYDNGDSAGLTPLIFMHTLGRDFVPPPLHAGGLRYHGMAPLVSHCVRSGLVEPVAVGQEEASRAAGLFLRTEGILPAPESSHAAAVAVREAIDARSSGVSRTILFNLSGHGFLDL